MSEHTEHYYDGDNLLEGVVINKLWGPITQKKGGFEDNPLALLLDTSQFGNPPTKTSLSNDFKGAVAECRSMGMTDDEIEHCIRLNLRTYGCDDKTFPVAEWMEA